MPEYRLKFTPEARVDVETAAGYYNSQLPGLGKVFKQEIKRQFVLLKQNPFTRSVRYNDVRFAVTRKFPYSIHYTIENSVIIVHAEICDSRDPMDHWKV